MVSETQVSADVNVVGLENPRACEHELVGGKGANLGQLVRAGFRVPSGFVVTTEAYTSFLTVSGLEAEIRGLLAEIDYASVESLEAKTERIRELISRVQVPAALNAEIEQAYADAGADRYVAVRSSGTAEDLEGTSFAGLHDTYLDVRGVEALLDAVKRCWASLWTARATGYRQHHGFDHFDARLAVVVQDMVSSEVSGVMFTGNPRTAATDETVINASWGLGEAVVQGIVTPDEYTVKSGALKIDGVRVVGSRHVLERAIGSKEKQYIRNPETGQGTVLEEVGPARRSECALSDEAIGDLVAIGRRITDHYDGYPQDVEWALADGVLHVLQSRPITGVEFSWDADINNNHHVTSFRYPTQDPFAVRTRAMADEAWTGAITPLMYSWRANQWNQVFWEAATRLGRPDLLDRIPMYYYRGYAYWDCTFERGIFAESALPMSRSFSLDRLPDDLRDEANLPKFGVLDWVKQVARSKLLRPDLGPYGWFKVLDDYIENRRQEADGVPDSELGRFSDDELIEYTEHQIIFEELYNRDVCFPGFFMLCRDAMAALGQIVNQWYTGDNEHAFTHLVTGTPEATWTVREHVALWRLANHIREIPELSAAFETDSGSGFFDYAATLDTAAEFTAGVKEFLEMSGHRGHADRDIYYTRYAEDPVVLYSALASHLKSEDNPLEQERRNNDLRNAAYEDVLSNIARGPLGFVKAEAFKVVHDYVMRFLTFRDNERWLIDRNTFSIKKGLLELNQRLMARGLFETERDFYFLTWAELLEYAKGGGNARMIRWKIESRMRNFDAWDYKQVSMPKFLQRNAPRETLSTMEAVDPEGRKIMHGFGTSGGEITATARVIRNLKEVGRVNKGDIMITNSTDPGWTPVFAALSGVIVETGGLLSHSGCLAREYGFPAAHIEDSVNQIPDGATITLNGTAGWVRIEHAEVEAPPVLVDAVG